MAKQEFYFAVYDKEDTYNEGECLTNFDTEDDARDFVNTENAGYGYAKLYYREEELNNDTWNYFGTKYKLSIQR